MWFLLSTRLRTWFALAVALPVARAVIRRAASRADRHDPDAKAARVLHRADSVLTTATRRRKNRN